MCSQQNRLFGAAFIPCYSEFVMNEQGHVDKPEPRWQALLAFLAVGAIYLALPRSLIGKSSFQFVNEEDKVKPRVQQYKIFTDMPIANPEA